MKTTHHPSFLPRFHYNNPSPIRRPGKNRIQRRRRQSAGELVFYEMVGKLAKSAQADDVGLGVLWAGAAPGFLRDRKNYLKSLSPFQKEITKLSATLSQARHVLTGDSPFRILDQFFSRMQSVYCIGVYWVAKSFGHSQLTDLVQYLRSQSHIIPVSDSEIRREHFHLSVLSIMASELNKKLGGFGQQTEHFLAHLHPPLEALHDLHHIHCKLAAAPEDPDRVQLTKLQTDPMFSTIPFKVQQALQAKFLELEELWAHRGENPQKALATFDFNPRVLSGMGLGIWHWARQFGSES